VQRRIGRRTLFFGLIALICLVLVPAMPVEFRWVAWGSAILAGIWAILFFIEDLARREPREEVVLPEKVPVEPQTPFPPPPPPRVGRR
jgi:hypothetical protein